jgi:hypothetical protein
MGESPFRLPLLIDSGALIYDVCDVLDIDYRVMQLFDTEEEAVAIESETRNVTRGPRSHPCRTAGGHSFPGLPSHHRRPPRGR